MIKILEKDWKKLRYIEDSLLDRACNITIKNLKNLIDKKEGGSYKTFLKIYKLIEEENKKIADMFNDMRRSNALSKIAFMYKYKIIDEKALSEFSEETQRHVRSLIFAQKIV